MNPKISFHTLGCRLNQAETAILQHSFEEKGYKVVDFGEPADVVVVNTCTVTENGDNDTKKLVNKINRLNHGSRIALIGCQAQIQRRKLLSLPNVNWIVGNSRKMEFADILSETYFSNFPKVIVPAISRKTFKISTVGVDRKHTRANLKIQDGCDFFCSFCVIPYARGRARSREFDDIIKEAQTLVSAGHREIVITGINVGTYQYQSKNILDIIEYLQKLNGLRRLRISSIEPTTIPGELVKLIAQGNKICRYLHIPLQSGSNKILIAMNRQYNVDYFSKCVGNIHQNIPDICIGTDVIVGFPGESKADFNETYRVLNNLPFAYFHVFSYSERPWAKSQKLDQKIPKEIIKVRSQVLRELSIQKRQAFMQKQIGKVQNVLFEQKKNGYWTGLTDTYIRVNVESTKNIHNQLLPVLLKNFQNNSMKGDLV